MEQPFVLETPDDKRIYGLLHPAQKGNTNAPVVVIVHGLTGHMNEYMHIRLAQLLSRNGYPAIRFSHYEDEPGARTFHDSTIREHVADTTTVLEYARSKGYSRVILAGHSLGSPVAIAATTDQVDGLILVDPTGWPADRIKDWQTYDPEHRVSYLNWARRIILGERWIKDAQTFPNSYDQFSKVACPIHIIAAERGDQMAYCQRYHEIHPAHPPIKIISAATHCFTEEGATESLATEISVWLSSLADPRSS